MQTPSYHLLHSLKQHEANFYVSVPCKLLAELILLLEKDPEITYVPATREEEGIGICAGAYLAGMTPVMLLQNSGIGNSITALCSLAIYYQLPLVMIISHRGTPGEKVNAQVPMSQATKPILETIGVPTFTFSHPTKAKAIGELVDYARMAQRPVAVLLDFHFWQREES